MSGTRARAKRVQPRIGPSGGGGAMNKVSEKTRKS